LLMRKSSATLAINGIPIPRPAAVDARNKSLPLVAYSHQQVVSIEPRLRDRRARIAPQVGVQHHVRQRLAHGQPHAIGYWLWRPQLLDVGDHLVAQPRDLVGSRHPARHEAIRDHSTIPIPGERSAPERFAVFRSALLRGELEGSSCGLACLLGALSLGRRRVLLPVALVAFCVLLCELACSLKRLCDSSIERARVSNPSSEAAVVRRHVFGLPAEAPHDPPLSVNRADRQRGAVTTVRQLRRAGAVDLRRLVCGGADPDLRPAVDAESCATQSHAWFSCWPSRPAPPVLQLRKKRELIAVNGDVAARARIFDPR